MSLNPRYYSLDRTHLSKPEEPASAPPYVLDIVIEYPYQEFGVKEEEHGSSKQSVPSGGDSGVDVRVGPGLEDEDDGCTPWEAHPLLQSLEG